ncbi:hypothetical protein [Streptomyces sp. NPDC058718]|uniref:hypothetical protein n=1 Tax=Streptomyces sp. NPDC058718 TaxID=3346610 RepID=UPI003680DF7E
MTHTTTRTRFRQVMRRRRVRQSLAATTTVVLAALSATPAVAASEPRPAQQSMGRGALLGVTPVAGLSQAEVAAFLKGADIDPATVRHGVRVYRLTYRALTPRGEPTTATGLLVRTKLPRSVKELLTDGFYERLRRPDGGLLAALEAQDGTCDWKPDVRVRLHSAVGDTDVAIANSISCAADLARNGVTAPVVDH